MKKWLPGLVFDLFGLLGVVSIGYGCYLIYFPSMFIVVGLMLTAIAIIGARK